MLKAKTLRRKVFHIIFALAILLSVLAFAVPAYATGPPAVADSAVVNAVITDVAAVSTVNTGATMLVTSVNSDAASQPVITSTVATVSNESAVLTLLNTMQKNAGLIAVVALVAILFCLAVVLACRRSYPAEKANNHTA